MNYLLHYFFEFIFLALEQITKMIWSETNLVRPFGASRRFGYMQMIRTCECECEMNTIVNAA